VTRHLQARKVVTVILPSDASPPGRRWGPDQDRLHRHLLRQPALLPKGGRLLMALSGGQDSMALLGLLRDLQSLHGWHLNLWHGNHGWHSEAAAQAQALKAWAERQQLPLHGQRADPSPATEAEAREWRYKCLQNQAEALCCSHVLTAHTATDRAETLLLNLARGSHRRGLGALRASRPLANGIQLVRPLLPFTREDTARICQEMDLPLWIDPSNAETRFSRNRVRADVLPVLEDLHPGATTRMAALAERLAQEEEQSEEVLAVALGSLAMAPDQQGAITALNRRSLAALQPANQRLLVQQWLRLHWGSPLEARSLERLLARLPLDQGPGRHDLAQGWHLRWEGCSLLLFPPTDHGRPG
jgi:tRNA(Ile)-lysidine synthase